MYKITITRGGGLYPKSHISSQPHNAPTTMCKPMSEPMCKPINKSMNKLPPTRRDATTHPITRSTACTTKHKSEKLHKLAADARRMEHRLATIRRILASVKLSIGQPAAKILGKCPIYCISLPESTDRLAAVQASAESHHIANLIRVSPGIRVGSSKTGPVSVPYDQVHNNVRFRLACNMNYRRNNMLITNAELGCTIAHMLALRTFLTTSTLDFAIICEDDACFDFIPFWPKSLTEIISTAPPDWELLQLQSHYPIISDTTIWRPWENETSTGFYLIRRVAINRVWDAHCRDINGVPTFTFPVDPSIFCENIIADRFLFQLFKTYTNRHFAAAPVADTISTIRDNVGCIFGMRYKTYLLYKHVLDLVLDRIHDQLSSLARDAKGTSLMQVVMAAGGHHRVVRVPGLTRPHLVHFAKRYPLITFRPTFNRVPRVPRNIR